jgi:hypothetical protein
MQKSNVELLPDDSDDEPAVETVVEVFFFFFFFFFFFLGFFLLVVACWISSCVVPLRSSLTDGLLGREKRHSSIRSG